MSRPQVFNLVDKYYNEERIFVDPSTRAILRELQNDPNLSGITLQDVQKFKRTLYEISKETESRILRGKKRYDEDKHQEITLLSTNRHTKLHNH